MRWKIINQEESFIEQEKLPGGLQGVVYHDNLLLLAHKESNLFVSLCCWNISITLDNISFNRFLDTNSWSTHIIEELRSSYNLIAYRNTLLACEKKQGQLSLAMLDLNGKAFFRVFLMKLHRN